MRSVNFKWPGRSMFQKLGLLSLALGSLSLRAQEPSPLNMNKEIIVLPNPSFIVRQNETQRIALGSHYFVHRIFVDAVSANSQDSMGEVRLGGETKGTIYVPGHDPTYVVTIAEEAQQLEFVGTLNALKVLRIRAEVSRIHDPSYPGENLGRLDAISTRVIELCRYLEYRVSPMEYQNYINPINNSASLARAYARARGDLSDDVKLKFKNLIAQIEVVESSPAFLDRLFKNPQTQMQSIELLSLKERLKKLFF